MNLHLVRHGSDTETAALAFATALGAVYHGRTDFAAVGAVPRPDDPTTRRVIVALNARGFASVAASAFVLLEAKTAEGLRIVHVRWLHDDACSRAPSPCACGLGLLQELKASWETRA